MARQQPPPHPDGDVFIVYDHRAIGGDTEDASVIECCGSLKEARRSWRGYGYPVYKVTIKDGVGTDEEFIEVMR